MLTRLSLSVLNHDIRKKISFANAKTLYTDSAMGLDDYIITRMRTLVKYGSGVEGFRKKMSDRVNKKNSIVFTEDLKNFCFLINNTPEDLSILSDLIVRYNCQKSDSCFDVIKTGPITMRALHYFNQPDMAFKLFMNSKTNEFFKQITTYILLEDLLYENKKYRQVREVYDKIKTLLSEPLHLKLLVVVIALSCYKENTPESLEYGLNIFKEIINKDKILTIKIVSALGALALNQKVPHITLEILSQFSEQKDISVKSLLLIALAEVGRLEHILAELQFILQRSAKNNQLYNDVLLKIQKALNHQNFESNSEVSQLFQKLQLGGYISELTLDQHLTMPIDLHSNNNKKLQLFNLKLNHHDKLKNWSSKSCNVQNY